MDAEFDDLKREFLDEAEEKVQEIETILKSGSLSTEPSCDRALYLAHQLKGAGGSYGFPNISTEAAALEADLEKARDGNGDVSGVQGRVSRLREDIAARRQELTAS